MVQLNRETRLRLARSLLDSDEWELLKTEAEEQIKYTKTRINNATELGDTNQLFAAESYRMALEFILALPQRIVDENKRFYDHLYDKALQVK